MELLEAMAARRSVRSFAEREIPAAELLELCRLASTAPRAGNRQSDRKLIPVADRELLRRLAGMVGVRWRELLAESSEAVREELRDYIGNFDFFAAAPAVVFVAGRRPPGFVAEMLGDAAEKVHGNGASALMAAEQLILAAGDRGIGSCMMTGLLAAEEEMKELLGLNGRWRLYGAVALGYVK